ncbi:MAG TPA: Tim44-like domain-containing protein [Chthoniobacterales bacterium]
MKPLLSRIFPVSVIIAALLLVAPEVALARAGGGGNGKGSWLNIILLPILLIYSAIITHQVRRKGRACRELLARLAKQDPVWDLDAIRHRITQVFFKVQQAWMERDQNTARDCMSNAIFEKHKMQTDQLISQHRKNVLENINLIETDIVDVEDFADNRKDQFWVYVKGSMIDYTIDDTTNAIVSGKREAESFTELWKFIRAGDTWVLDEIDQKVSLSELRDFKATTDSVPG